MANIKNNSASKHTQRRLLEAAGEVFAERGFHSATMKEITDRAEASLASINYHFSDKAELYAAVIRTLIVEHWETMPTINDPADPPELRFKRFVLQLVERCLRCERPRWEHVLIGREMAQPTGALDPFIEKVIRPLNECLSAIVAEITGRKISDPVVGLIVASIVGQTVYHAQKSPHTPQFHSQFIEPLDASTIAEHIATFSLAGIEAYKLKS
jgi:AcrR family transcriptional regulator